MASSKRGVTRGALACLAAVLAVGAAADGEPTAPRAPVVLPVPPMRAVLAAPVGGGAAEESGFRRFLVQQTEAAKAAQRRKDPDAAAAAWGAVLEMDPVSLVAIEGLAEAARAKEDTDAEVFWRTELEDGLRRAIAAGDKNQERNLPRITERLQSLDPQHGQSDTLVEDYSAAQARLGEEYLADGFYGNAQLAWLRRLALCAPGSPEAAAAGEALSRISREGGDEVAGRFDAIAQAGDKDQAWIDEFDKKSAKWSNAARWETPHYRIKTCAGWRMGTEVAGVMERVNAFYREIWGIVPDPKPTDPKLLVGLHDLNITPIDVNIFTDHAEYAKRTGAPEWSGGIFTGSEVDTYDQSGGGKSSGQTLTTLFHEASHQFMSVAVGDVPSFVNEGVASLFEGIEILSNGTIRRDLPVGHYLSPLAEKLKKGTAKPLREIFNAQENKPEQYEYRWGVMYFLRNYVDGQGNYVYRARLQDYIWEFKKGSPGDMVEHFTKFVIDQVKVEGIETFAQFEAVWKQWIIDLADEQHTSDKRLDAFRKRGLGATAHGDHEGALRHYDKALDIDPDDLECLWGLAVSCEGLGKVDRSTANYRRFIALSDEDDERRLVAIGKVEQLDPHDAEVTDARRTLAGGMAGLALEYDRNGLPRMALRSAKRVLTVDPFEPGSRALVTRIERDKGLTVDRWRRLFNGFDMEGWYGVEGKGSFFVADGKLVNDSTRVEGKKPGAGAAAGAGAGGGAPAGSATYQALMVDRKVDGDWSLEARIECEADWKIVGLLFGAKDSDHYEAVVLRHTGDGTNNVDFGTYASGDWSFGRTDGSVKAAYDAAKGVLLRIDVRGKTVSVTVDGKLVKGIVNKVSKPSIKYPLAALRGDIGLLASKGVTHFSDVRLLSGGGR